MKEFIKDIINADGVQWAGFLALVFLGSLAALVITALAADHKVRCYYPQSEMKNSGTAYMIIADIDWGYDKFAFTTTNSAEMLEVLDTLQLCAEKRLHITPGAAERQRFGWL